MPLPKSAPTPRGLDVIENYFDQRGWKLWPFQQRAIAAYRAGKSGLISVPTGSGKTFAAILGPVSEWLSAPQPEGLKILYITPLKAVARDIEKAISEFLEAVGSSLSLESRTGDTSSYRKAQQKEKLPNILITTPESLSLLISYENCDRLFCGIESVIVDEWHELLASKRGSLLELSLARLRGLKPQLRIWALSATLGNLLEAAQVVCARETPELIVENLSRPLIADTLIPEKIEALSWAGHLGLSMLPNLLARIDIDRSTLIFTNTRSFCERWYQALLEAKPEWAEVIAIHHGSINPAERRQVEEGVKGGDIKIVVTTSSLDLGVDFPTVDQVFQIGSPKGVARLLQRAGRSAHRPGLPARIALVPTHALELAEFSALKAAVAAEKMESRVPLPAPLDVLLQYIVTRALGGGFAVDPLYAEIRSAHSYRNLAREDFDACLDLARYGGSALYNYPQYRKIVEACDRFIIADESIARLHRMNIGTIASQSSVQVSFLGGKELGFIDESFVGKLKRGDVFYFAGRALKLMMIKDMQAYVRLAPKGSEGSTPRWSGNRLPFSTELSETLRGQIGAVAHGEIPSPELGALEPVWKVQRQVSQIPAADELLIEKYKSREGQHFFVFPFEGAQLHEGLASIMALRLARKHRTTFSIAVNDFGFELLTADDFPYLESLNFADLVGESLNQDIAESLNKVELSRRQFREVARVSGLTFQQFGRALKTTRQVQASAGLLFDVLKKYDTDNLLIRQADAEVLEQQFQEKRLEKTLLRLAKSRLSVRETKRPSPLAFPLLVERMGSQLSNETMLERLRKMKARWPESSP